MSAPLFTGCATALVTPFTREAPLDERALRRLIVMQADAGVDALVLLGTVPLAPVSVRPRAVTWTALDLPEPDTRCSRSVAERTVLPDSAERIAELSNHTQPLHTPRPVAKFCRSCPLVHDPEFLQVAVVTAS